jgi:hypothetical protein
MCKEGNSSNKIINNYKGKTQQQLAVVVTIISSISSNLIPPKAPQEALTYKTKIKV